MKLIKWLRGVCILSHVAFISGASGGIGQAIARKLAQQGFSLILHFNQNEQDAFKLKGELMEEFDLSVLTIQADLSRPEGVRKIVKECPVPPSVIIHNAGRSHFGLFTDITTKEYEEMVQMNLTSPFQLTQHWLPTMISNKWGRIIFITSIWGETGASCESLYSMVKGGINALAKSLAKELAPSQITVNAVSPGAIATSMMDHFTEEELRNICEEIPMGRMGLPEEVASTVGFLLSEESNYITGQIIRVNGGWYT